MMSHRVIARVRIAPVLGIVTAVAALGAGPQEPWRTVQSGLPPVVISPGMPPVPNRGLAPGIPQPIPQSWIPQPMPPRPDRAVKPASNQVPAGPGWVPAPPAVPVTPAPRPAVVPHIAHVPGKIGSPEAIGLTAASTAVPLTTGTNTRVYVINGVDPFGWAGLSQMADRIRASGYPETKYGAWFQVLKFDRDIRAAYRQDPSSQFVIIGYSFGVYRAKALANRLTRDGIPVAMVGYIGGDYLRNSPASQMAGGPRVVNVTGDGYLLTGRNLFFNGTDLNGADNVRMPGVRHFGLPKQEQTLSALVNGMNAATGRAWVNPTDSTGIADGGVIIPTPPTTMPARPTAPTTSSARPFTTGQR